MLQKSSEPILTHVVAWFLMAGIWILWTAGCGAMLALQDEEMSDQHTVAVESCSQLADQAASSDSRRARAADAYCLEDRDRWAAWVVASHG
jgi:hypothetical protein